MHADTRRRGKSAHDLASSSHGVVARRQLADVGITRHHVRRNIDAGRWATLGPQTVRVLSAPWDGCLSPIVATVHDVGAGAWADGESALLLAGLHGWQSRTIQVTTTRGLDGGERPGVEVHRVGSPPRLVAHPVRRAHPDVAALRAAAWAGTDRQAAALLSMSVQQRLMHPGRPAATLETMPRLRRRRLIAGFIRDIAGGAESMGEIDFVRECRRRGIRPPDEQVVRVTANGTYHLDAYWRREGLVAEVNGAHHYVVTIPRIALRVAPEPFFAQIERYLARFDDG